MGLIRQLLGPRKRKKMMKKKLRPKTTFGRHVVKIQEIAQERQNRGSIESQWTQNGGKILKLFSKNRHFGIPGINFESRLNHTKRGHSKAAGP